MFGLVYCSYKVAQEVQRGQTYSGLHYQREENQKPEGRLCHHSNAHTVLYQYQPISGACRCSGYLEPPRYRAAFPGKSTEEKESKLLVLVRFKLCVLTDLPVGDADEPLVHQFVCFGVSGLPLHDVALGCFVSQGDGGDLGGGTKHRSFLSINV